MWSSSSRGRLFARANPVARRPAPWAAHRARGLVASQWKFGPRREARGAWKRSGDARMDWRGAGGAIRPRTDKPAPFCPVERKGYRARADTADHRRFNNPQAPSCADRHRRRTCGMDGAGRASRRRGPAGDRWNAGADRDAAGAKGDAGRRAIGRRPNAPRWRSIRCRPNAPRLPRPSAAR